MAIAAASSLPLGHSHCHSCHTEGVCCSTRHGISSSWMKSPFDGRRYPDPLGVSLKCRNPLVGPTQFHWLSIGHGLCLSKVSVAADFSDSAPESSSYMTNQGYHPLEELKACKMVRDTKLTFAEIARTTVEANDSALLVFPGKIHSEPHEQISWAEFQYVIDDYGDLYFELFDDANILEDPTASNPVNALFGMDIPVHNNGRITGGFSILDDQNSDDIPFDDDYLEVVESEAFDVLDWEIPDASTLIHPIYFAKCLTKAINIRHDRKMDHPSNGVSILGCLIPAFADEEFYVRRLFHYEDSDYYNSDEKGGKGVSISSKSDRSKNCSTLYRLEIMRIELFSVYGVQSTINLQDFQDAEPDFLINSISDIVERFNERGIRCDVALKALCKRKGLQVEGAHLIGVDSLGMDVRVFSGSEVQTHRFPFRVRAKSEVAAEKQIEQLLFPRSRRKKLRSQGNNFQGVESY
ncbi:putative FMN-binding split barrel [Rosa chinensis]|uniref:Putative FMN-binding split barrel n=1 Tax=Rosa chinensis TaxID=74649 RepID=A0A2P6QV14_ROSCH|nr:uncharacterized protein At3g49140 isoform X1 [Rosa chinensis]XP_024193230.1 uncharacterized protein At3g49140 isoform X1 [Rosa chinensis]PRQ37979.1 putative FMN-binding split barrel [Rosa chinensis]